jgi:hypothetical protein
MPVANWFSLAYDLCRRYWEIGRFDRLDTTLPTAINPSRLERFDSKSRVGEAAHEKTRKRNT